MSRKLNKGGKCTSCNNDATEQFQVIKADGQPFGEIDQKCLSCAVESIDNLAVYGWTITASHKGANQ